MRCRRAKSPRAWSATPATRRCRGKKRSEERRVGKECRSLCDWSSDVCSSDLLIIELHIRLTDALQAREIAARVERDTGYKTVSWQEEIGRASCRERV